MSAAGWPRPPCRKCAWAAESGCLGLLLLTYASHHRGGVRCCAAAQKGRDASALLGRCDARAGRMRGSPCVSECS
eukprot:9846616-Heterocapsa_arctica.AAC.1